MKKTDNKKLIIFCFFPKKLIKADFWKVVYPNKKTYVTDGWDIKSFLQFSSYFVGI